MRARPGCLAVLLVAAGCGRVERVDLVVRPRQDDFGSEIQPLLEQVGCSAQGACHSIPLGDLQIVVDPDPNQLQENYLGVKAQLNLREPEHSLLLEDLLPQSVNPDANHPTVCWTSRDACSYRKILAWAAWSGAGDPRPQEIDCDSSGDLCALR